jgi:predicted transcriptional regulator
MKDLGLDGKILDALDRVDTNQLILEDIVTTLSNGIDEKTVYKHVAKLREERKIRQVKKEVVILTEKGKEALESSCSGVLQ